MRSQLPKVLHPLAGQPMIVYVLEAAEAAGAGDLVVVVGPGADQVRAVLGTRARYATQEVPLGTGHAVLQAYPLLAPACERLLVLYGDTPLLTADSLRTLLAASREATIALLTAEVDAPQAYGRIVRDAAGRVLRVVEEVDAAGAERGIREVNVGAYVFDTAWLGAHLPQLRPSRSGEYYLTDLVALAAAEGQAIATVPLADPVEGLGVNDRCQLARAEAVLRGRVRERLMRAGVTLIDPASTFVDATVEVGVDTVLYPHTFLQGRTRVGARCEIGPSTQLVDTEVGDACRIVWSVLEGAVLSENVQVGPFAHLRPGARLARGVVIGNYAEVKNSILHEDVQQHHFSYIGDAEVGRGTNIGAGTITCNYDGQQKHRTEIGPEVFLGSDTLLVAPVRLGARSGTGAGAVVVRDVPEGPPPASPVKGGEGDA
ncbi:MAG TPA: bifunctional UDP-N-acetylglucosamine diphosphorylase/glucosamine-1-phosphate N-acetyltransferase GlmU [Chloroflexota bacterium]|nr:bifunctional UDP-N-acetylglucosamine diphosphorylase/glucosamine-1-phosphate N-acetyltransferase GlmU [Chloroflexota bacterium]